MPCSRYLPLALEDPLRLQVGWCAFQSPIAILGPFLATFPQLSPHSWMSFVPSSPFLLVPACLIPPISIQISFYPACRTFTACAMDFFQYPTNKSWCLPPAASKNASCSWVPSLNCAFLISALLHGSPIKTISILFSQYHCKNVCAFWLPLHTFW